MDIAPGRRADVHMWVTSHQYGSGTARIQTFRDREGRDIALITLRDGDVDASPDVAAAEYRSAAWREFFSDAHHPPVVIFNLLGSKAAFDAEREVIITEFDTDGRYLGLTDISQHDLIVLNQLGAEWDEGIGFVPLQDPPVTHLEVLRKVAVCELPEGDLFRDMNKFMAVDWAAAVSLAAECLSSGSKFPPDLPAHVPRDLAKAAQSFWRKPIRLIVEPDEPPRFGNGQHRAEALRRQNATVAIMLDTRLVDSEPLPGEIRIVKEL
ncbi:Uncharacterised protein [Mycobacteroides abscessus]|uniref:Uncharacterized protein n=3 Tax=Mycobacteroides abscessus TaxID=36809 RepID=A0AB74FAM7_9MYCO|nr:hypothetical protein [Mycobacteroides abscessus]AKP58740.1 hypothetical protein MAUC22_14810 [Mycobacteroides abscessus UC22]MBN7342680.1 hypothetical protein [Mycobacteroides abscessus subsp. massiliense]MBN7397426.1 hypothetical protein [Mycobacteroides abscessus subsp. abscessus]MBN7542016.1 hypothetical protein [Mycobacteroides abscessus subsp. massiliense]MDB2308646.1 hypothetical protein [Mycobacteroides abscessus subsp. massiliense]